MKYQRGFATLIVIGIIAVLLAGGGGYAYMKKSQVVSESLEVLPVPEVVATESEEEVTTKSMDSETSDWETYTNSEYGFSFQYPKQYYIVSEGSGHVTLDDLKYKDSDKFRQRTVVILYQQSSLGSLLTELGNEVSGDKGWVTRIEQISTSPVLYKVYINNSKEASYGFAEVGDKYIRIHGYSGPTIDQIFSTLKFTKPTTTAGPQIYYDPYNRFSFQYPKDLILSMEKSVEFFTDSVRFKTVSNSSSFSINLQTPTERWPDLETLVGDQYLMSKGGDTPAPIFRTLPSGLKLQDVGVNGFLEHQFVGQLNTGEFVIFSFKDESLIEQVLSSFTQTTATKEGQSATVINGPKSLSVGKRGVWNVVNPGASEYAVIWADGSQIEMTEGQSGIPASSAFTSSSEFTHTFLKSGTYSVQFFSRYPVDVETFVIDVK